MVDSDTIEGEDRVKLRECQRRTFEAIKKEAFKDEKGNGRHPDMMWFNETFRYGNGDDARGLLFSSVSK